MFNLLKKFGRLFNRRKRIAQKLVHARRVFRQRQRWAHNLGLGTRDERTIHLKNTIYRTQNGLKGGWFGLGRLEKQLDKAVQIPSPRTLLKERKFGLNVKRKLVERIKTMAEIKGVEPKIDPERLPHMGKEKLVALMNDLFVEFQARNNWNEFTNMEQNVIDNLFLFWKDSVAQNYLLYLNDVNNETDRKSKADYFKEVINNALTNFNEQNEEKINIDKVLRSVFDILGLGEFL